MNRVAANARLTFAELVVVIAIVTLIASILLPGIQAAHRKGRQTLCMQNLKRLSVSTELYVSGAGGYLPMAMAPAGATDAQYWFRQLAASGVLGDDSDWSRPGSLLSCPASRYRTGKEEFVSYGWSSYLGDVTRHLEGRADQWVRRVPRSAVKRAADVILGGDGALRRVVCGGTDAAYEQIWPAKTWYRERGQMTVFPAVHGPHFNYLFADGHVDAVHLADQDLISNPAHNPYTNHWVNVLRPVPGPFFDLPGPAAR